MFELQTPYGKVEKMSFIVSIIILTFTLFVPILIGGRFLFNHILHDVIKSTRINVMCFLLKNLPFSVQALPQRICSSFHLH